MEFWYNHNPVYLIIEWVLKHCICFSAQHVIQISQAWLFWQLLTCLKRRQTIKMTFAAVYVWVCFCCWTPRHLFIIVHVMPDLFSAMEKWVGQNLFYMRLRDSFFKSSMRQPKYLDWGSQEHKTFHNKTNTIKHTFLPTKIFLLCFVSITNIFHSS